MDKRANILIVDDEEEIRSLLAEIIEDNTKELYTAGDGQEALEILKNNKVDLVLSDIQMPNMDGMELLEKATQLYPGLLFLFITGFGNVQNSRIIMRSGAYDIIDKPFEEKIVQNRVLNAILHLKMLSLESHLLKCLAGFLGYQNQIDISKTSTEERYKYCEALLSVLDLKTKNNKNVQSK